VIETIPKELRDAMLVAADCGMTTVEEAVRNADLHCQQFMAYDDIPEYLKKLYAQYRAWGGGPKIPDEIMRVIAEEDEELSPADIALAKDADEKLLAAFKATEDELCK
jgi:hypothetical protein